MVSRLAANESTHIRTDRVLNTDAPRGLTIYIHRERERARGGRPAMGLEVRLELLLLYCEFDVVVVALDGLQHTPAHVSIRPHAHIRSSSAACLWVPI